ncbi:MAG TPA: prephenate dehydratase domain-containing protein [Bacteroidia bacterium]|jgi:prephenate dehydratase|nr:prephenate dehydratase domain-containing protein [Bacteroidia bacterium]
MRKSRVAIQGTAASFHEQAALQYFGNDIEIVECNSFSFSCKQLSDNMADYCVMAIENSLAGSILTNYNLITQNKLKIIGEVYLKIELHLLCLPETGLKEIEFIQSHPMAIKQCADFINAHPLVNVIESHDTAACAQLIAGKQLVNTAAIAGEAAAQRYGLKILERNIESNKENYTRFFVLSKGDYLEEIPDKSTLCFKLEHTPGSLVNALSVFKKYLVNLSRIQSVPIEGQPGQFRFYTDAEWLDKLLYEKCMKELAKKTNDLQILGEYKKHELTESKKLKQ